MGTSEQRNFRYILGIGPPDQIIERPVLFRSTRDYPTHQVSVFVIVNSVGCQYKAQPESLDRKMFKAAVYENIKCLKRGLPDANRVWHGA